MCSNLASQRHTNVTQTSHPKWHQKWRHPDPFRFHFGATWGHLVRLVGSLDSPYGVTCFTWWDHLINLGGHLGSLRLPCGEKRDSPATVESLPLSPRIHHKQASCWVGCPPEQWCTRQQPDQPPPSLPVVTRVGEGHGGDSEVQHEARDRAQEG